MSVPRPRLPDKEPFELEFEHLLNVLEDNLIHGMQNNHSDDNYRRPDSEKISQSFKKIFDDEFRMYDEAQ